MVRTRNIGGALVLLLPGAKMIRRLHPFDLMDKLALNEALYEYIQNWTSTVLVA